MTTALGPLRLPRAVPVVLSVVVGLALPTLLYYLLRALGAGVYLALVVSAVVSAAPGLWSTVRRRRVGGLSTYLSAMVLGGLVVSLLPGSARFLLAREAVMTAVTGVWFLASTRTGRPLAYLFTRPLMEGRFRWPRDWDRLWDVSPRFRRMWRVSSALFGVGLLLDAAFRVVIAYTVRPDLVPALGLAMYVATTVVLNVVVTVYYVHCRVHDPRSPLRRGVATDGGPA